MTKIENHEEFQKAHELCRNNKDVLNKTDKCGCFYCLRQFAPSEIKEYIRKGEETALCPYCNIDAVLPGEYSKEFLEEMYEYWFKI